MLVHETGQPNAPIFDHPHVRTLLSDPERAWQPYEPSGGTPWTRTWAAHALRRAGFGGSWSELQRGVRLGPQRLIDELWHGFQQPRWPDELFDNLERTFLQVNSDIGVQAVWILRMLHGGRPLVERMTLFWHDHFATSQDKVQNLRYMVGQIRLFRRYERGEPVIEGGRPHEFESLLRAVSRDPAMLVWLDGNANRRVAPNENYARELMELFTLGIGNYTEKDIKEAARAFTGWFVRRGRFFFAAAEHDYGQKTILNQTGNWDGDDVIRIVLQQPAASRFLVQKLYRWFINELDPIPDGLLEPLYDSFRNSGFDTHALVDRMVRSRVFFSPLAYRRKVASPVDYVVGTVRRLEPASSRPRHLATILAQLGQQLLHPPSVAGWDDGPAWINAQTLIIRARFIRNLVRRSGGPFEGSFDPVALARRYGFGDREAILRFYVTLMLDGRLPRKAMAALSEEYRRAVPSREDGEALDRAARGLVVALATQPEYQLV